MSKIRSQNTGPEKAVRSALHRKGFRFSLKKSNLPGKPDIVLPKYKTAIFVHGCFWHQHKNCHRANIPKSNIEYWNVKLLNNVKRDKKYVRLLKKEGWKILIVWECEIGHNALLKKLSRLEK